MGHSADRGTTQRHIHWKALVVYLGAGFGVLEAVGLLIDRVGLPEWLFTTALLVLALGLPLAVWRGVPSMVGHTSDNEGVDSFHVEVGRATRWGRVALVLLACSSLWGVIATAWLVLAGRTQADLRAEVAVAEVTMLAESGLWEEAHSAATAAKEAQAADSVLEELWPRFSRRVRIESTPPGATVFRAPYDPEATEWQSLGATPLDDIPFPFGLSRLRFEMPGFDPLQVVAGVPVERAPIVGIGDTIGPYVLDPVGTRPRGMIRVPGWTPTIDGMATRLGDFFIDQYEVTNVQYSEFVQEGGYQRPEFWTEPIQVGGEVVAWTDGVALFVDRTGRPGPATWEAGTYAQGNDEYPVAGISWYEAMAYARFVGKELPTRHHWERAMYAQASAWMLPRSNLERDRPAEVGAFKGLSPFGALDMAGNVREWALNRVDQVRPLMGGGWSDPYFTAVSGMVSSPLDRSELNGLRLASYPDSTGLAVARLPLPPRESTDFDAIPAISDEVFAVYRTQFTYDDTPLEAGIEVADTTDRWIRERISIRPGYSSDDRLLLYLYRPLQSASPLQTVVFFPGGAARTIRSIDQMRTIHLDFVLASGRAVALPVYWGTFERGHELTPRGRSAGYRDQAIRWSKDLRRSVDYLATREELDIERLAYYGYSFGGVNLATMVVMEPRFKAAIAYIGGFSRLRTLPEVDDISYVHRLTLPLLMLNGTLDPARPIEERVVPFYDLAGTEDEHKKLVLDQGGHFVPRTTLVRESLDWLDRYLGPVR